METILGIAPLPPGFRYVELRPEAIVVREERHAGSAAQFWGGLCCELRNLVPNAEATQLVAVDEHPLDPAELDPLHHLAHDLERLGDRDARQELRRALAQIEVFGPPPSVMLRVLHGQTSVLARELPRSFFDAELFRHFLCCMLAWAEAPTALWNADAITGEFEATCLPTGTRFHIAVELRNRSMPEGLVQRQLTVAPIAGQHTR